MPPAARRRTGDLAEDAAACHLEAAGWRIVARNVRVGRDELDILALDPGAPDPGAPEQLVIVEVRSHSTVRFGAPEESVDRAKVGRLYRAAWALVRLGRLPDGRAMPVAAWRIDLLTVVRDGAQGDWRVVRHLRGLHPP